MDQRFLDAYNRELTYLREMGREFAQEYPKVAAKLSLDNLDQPDPHVERLIESFAFLSARIALRQDDDYSVFTQNLLDMIYPDYLQPTPSVGIVELGCNSNDTALAAGVTIGRGAPLKTAYQKGVRTHCEFRTCFDTTLWPVSVTGATFSTFIPELPPGKISANGLAGSLKLTLEAGAGKKFSELPIESLRLFLASDYVVSCKIYEHLLSRVAGIVVVYADGDSGSNASPVWAEGVGLSPDGFGAEEALFPFGNRSFTGNRLIREYFVLPQKFLFVSMGGLSSVLPRVDAARCDIYLLLNRLPEELVNTVNAACFRLNCTPVVNLFHRHCDRVFVSERQREFHVPADKTRAADFEIIQITKVIGIDAEYDREVEFHPFFHSPAGVSAAQSGTWYSVERRRRVLSQAERTRENRISYPGTEIFLSIVDHASLPFSPKLRQLAVEAWCSNRDLPLLIKSGVLESDLILQGESAVKSVRFLVEPTKPLPSLAEGVVSWRLINLLSFNYLSMLDMDPESAANTVRQLLKLHVADGGEVSLRQVNAVRKLSLRRVVRRVPLPGPLVYAQGIEARVLIDETLFEGGGGFMFGKVLEVLLSRMSSLNSFVETVIESMQRGEIKRWPARLGNSPLL